MSPKSRATLAISAGSKIEARRAEIFLLELSVGSDPIRPVISVPSHVITPRDVRPGRDSALLPHHSHDQTVLFAEVSGESVVGEGSEDVRFHVLIIFRASVRVND